MSRRGKSGEKEPIRQTAARFGDLDAQVTTGATLDSIGARAASRGNAMWFASHRPDVATVAHELAHVAQFQAHPMTPRLRALDLRSDAAEIEADRVADTVARGGTPGPIVQRPSARVHRAPVLPTASEPNTGSFVLDPAIADVKTPDHMSTHVRVAPLASARSGPPALDRHVVLERAVRSAKRIEVYALSIYDAYVSAAAAQTPRPIVSTDVPMFLDGDTAYTPTGSSKIIGFGPDVVFTEGPLQETAGAGAVVLLETEAGRVLLDAGLQVTYEAMKQIVGDELGRLVTAEVGLTPLGEAISVPGAPNGPALPFIAAHVAIGALRSTTDQLDDGSVAEVLKAQKRYREWYEKGLRDDFGQKRADWESKQAIAPNASIRDERWKRYVDAEVARLMYELGTPWLALVEQQGSSTIVHDDVVIPTKPPSVVEGVPLDLSDTEWEKDDREQVLTVAGDGHLGTITIRGMLLRPVTATRSVTGLHAEGPLGASAAPTRPVTPWLALEAVGKEALLPVRINGTHYFLVDVGGNPAVIAPGALAALAKRLGVTNIDTVAITHPHADHIRYLIELVRRFQIRAENLIVSSHWPSAAPPPGEVVTPKKILGELRTTTDQALVALGYGPTWDPAGIAVDPNLRITHIRTPDGIDVYTRTAAQQAYRAGGVSAKAMTIDSASLLYVFGNESSGNRTAVIGDMRGKDILDFKVDLNHANPDGFRQAFRNVRVVQGLGHHFGIAAGRDVPEVEGLNALMEATLGQNGALTLLIQSDETFAFDSASPTTAGEGGALLRYFRRLGVDVVFVGDTETNADGTVRPRGALVDSEARVTRYGTGVHLEVGDPRVKAVQHRLELLREARRTVAANAELGPAALGLEGRTQADLVAALDAEIATIERLMGELRNLAAADLMDARVQADETGPKAAARRQFRTDNTTAGRTDADILTDLERPGATEAQLTTEVKQRLAAAIVNERPITVELQFAKMPTVMFDAIKGLPEDRKAAIAKKYDELTALTGKLEDSKVPEADRLEVYAKAIALRDELVRLVADLSGDAKGVAERELVRLNHIVDMLGLETERTTEVGRDIAGRPTRTEYIRLRQNLKVDRAFHNAGRFLGAMMVIHSIEGALPATTRSGDLNIPESAFKLAHSALGLEIGMRMASTSFRQSLISPTSGLRVGAEMAAMVVLEFGMAATHDYASSEERDAALVNTAINALCMAVGQGIMMIGARVPHPIGRGIVMGLGMAVMLLGAKVLSWLGLDDNIERWTSFPPGEVTHVNQQIGAVLKEYRLLIGARALSARSDEDLAALGIPDTKKLRDDLVTAEYGPSAKIASLESGLTTLFADAYARAQGAWVGLQMLDEQAAEFHRLRHMAMKGTWDINRPDIDARWRAIDEKLGLANATDAKIDGMEQWGELKDKLDELEKRLGDDDRDDMIETLDELNLMFENARYRISSANRGKHRPGAIIPADTTAYTAYLAKLRPLEQRLAALQERVLRWSGGTVPAGMTVASTDVKAMSGTSAYARLRGSRTSYDGLVTALAAKYPKLAEDALWADPVKHINAVEEANRADYAAFQNLRIAEIALRSAAEQAELALSIAPPAEITPAFRRLVTDEVEAARLAMKARRNKQGLVFLAERDLLLLERGKEVDLRMAAAIDVAFPSAGRTKTAGITPEEDEALGGSALSGSGRLMRSTAGMLTAHREQMTPWFSVLAGRDMTDPLSQNRIVKRDYALLTDGYRWADFEGINTYPWKDVQQGRTPLVANLAETHAGCNCKWCFCGPAMYVKVVAINRDAVLQLGPEPVYIRYPDLHWITPESIEDKAASMPKP